MGGSGRRRRWGGGFRGFLFWSLAFEDCSLVTIMMGGFSCFAGITWRLSCIWYRNFWDRGALGRFVVWIIGFSSFWFFSSLLSVFSLFSFLVGRKKEGLCNDFAWSLLHEREGLVGG